jgi:hypothetical protein
MDKVAYLTGYLAGLDGIVDQIQLDVMEKKAAVFVPEQKAYSYSPETLQAYLANNKREAAQKRMKAKAIGMGAGALGGLALGAKGGKLGALAGLILGGGLGGAVGHGLGEEGIVGREDTRPTIDILRDLKKQPLGPGSSSEEQYMAPFENSRIK